MDKGIHAASIFNKYANDYQNLYMDVSLYNDTFDSFCTAIEKSNASILELACGPGNISQHVLNKRPDFKWLGTDLAPNMVELAKQNNPGAEFEIMDCREIGKLKQQYDGLMCGFCLPYLSMSETEQLIKDAAGLLNTKGVIYLSTMEEAYSKSGLQKGRKGDEIYMHYYQYADLEKMLIENGFKILKVDRKEYEQQVGVKTVDLVIIAQNKNV
ncbi:MAG: class I SAM-dependent methyltransferase [Bacteroidetes bacterium]|nr:class I SAM-dependent methyltransferase [Bacteroidota bacterium]